MDITVETLNANAAEWLVNFGLRKYLQAVVTLSEYLAVAYVFVRS